MQTYTDYVRHLIAQTPTEKLTMLALHIAKRRHSEQLSRKLDAILDVLAARLDVNEFDAIVDAIDDVQARLIAA